MKSVSKLRELTTLGGQIMKTKFIVTLVVVILIGIAVSLWNVAKATPEAPLSFLRVGRRYRFTTNTMFARRGTPFRVLEVQSNWVKVSDGRDQWWINTYQIMAIEETR
jgi:hypothetical protein